MGKITIFFYVVLMFIAQAVMGECALALDQKPVTASESDDIIIASHVIFTPLERILLIRKDSEYCAIKFTKFWSGKVDDDRYAEYELYHQGDKVGSFLDKKAKSKKDKLSSPKPRGIGRFAFSFGNKEIKCGAIQLHWSGKGWLHFYGSDQKEGDYGIELAPTKWTNISQVNVFDPRVKWYRYDAKRKDIKIPIDRLWDDKEGGR